MDNGIYIAATGCYLPPSVVDNNRFTEIVETSDEWVTTRSGIKTRHFANGETTWYMGYMAARQALDRAGVKPEEVGMIICTTVTPDFISPSAACFIQRELGAVNSFCLDVNAACTAFEYAVDMARRYLAFGDIKNVLIVAAERLSQITDFSDRSTCVLFGDGAAACLVQNSTEKRFASFMGTDATGICYLHGRNPHRESPFGDPAKRVVVPEMENERDNFLYMDGKEVYKFATKAMPEALEKACERFGITVGELDWIIPHQANIRIVQTACKNMKIPMDKVFLTIDECGNTASASVPITLDRAVCEGRIQRGQKIGLVGFGAGLTYGATVFEY